MVRQSRRLPAPTISSARRRWAHPAPYVCPASLGNTGVLTIHNASGGVANFFIDSGGANPDYVQLGAGGFITYPASAGGESFSIQAQGAPGVGTVQAGPFCNASNDCHAQALVLVTP